MGNNTDRIISEERLQQRVNLQDIQIPHKDGCWPGDLDGLIDLDIYGMLFLELKFTGVLDKDGNYALGAQIEPSRGELIYGYRMVTAMTRGGMPAAYLLLGHCIKDPKKAIYGKDLVVYGVIAKTKRELIELVDMRQYMMTLQEFIEMWTKTVKPGATIYVPEQRNFPYHELGLSPDSPGEYRSRKNQIFNDLRGKTLEEYVRELKEGEDDK